MVFDNEMHLLVLVPGDQTCEAVILPISIQGQERHKDQNAPELFPVPQELGRLA
jgi:hypothetical protein